GMNLFRSLPATADREVLLCTDLHAENVLAAEREPWLLIDPKPYVGDPTYDPLQHLLNCEQRLRADPRALATRLADLLDLDRDRMVLWLFARCVQESPDRPLPSVNHRLPSGPAAIAPGSLWGVGTGNSVNTPDVLTRPILSSLSSANHRFPSGPAAMPTGPLKGVGTGSSVNTPLRVTRPTLSPRYSVNHRFPSGPAAMPSGLLCRVG